MAKGDFLIKVSRSFHKVGFQLKKHSPEILVVTGVVGTVVSAVMACKATTKINTVLDETKANVEAIHEAAEKKEINGVEYTDKDKKKDLTITYAKTGLNLVKLYGPSVIVGAASIGAILTSHNIVRKRNIALAAAYTAVDSGFKEYRGRVVERLGEEMDKELKYNIKAKEVEEKVVDENGKEQTVKKTVDVVYNTEPSDYARFYDDGCNGWTKNPEYNLMFLKQQQNYANDLLQSRGHLFLNEVYDMLGIPRTTAGQEVGWVLGCGGDDYVDFGLYDQSKERVRAFVNGYERVILLDFNVDGPVHHLLG